jgi:hypothetical protein
MRNHDGAQSLAGLQVQDTLKISTHRVPCICRNGGESHSVSGCHEHQHFAETGRYASTTQLKDWPCFMVFTPVRRAFIPSFCQRQPGRKGTLRQDPLASRKRVSRFVRVNDLLSPLQSPLSGCLVARAWSGKQIGAIGTKKMIFKREHMFT